MIHLICAVVVAASCLLLYEKNEQNIACCVQLCEEHEDVTLYVALKCSKVMPTIDTDLLTL